MTAALLLDRPTPIAVPRLEVRPFGFEPTGGRAGIRTARRALPSVLAVAAAVPLPLVAAGVLPDFVPALGAPAAAAPFSLWAYLGDGGGVGMFAFLLAGLLLVLRPHWISRRVVAAAAGYGAFVWTGFVAALMLPGGPATAVSLSPDAFLAHLAGGAVLGLALTIALRRAA